MTVTNDIYQQQQNLGQDRVHGLKHLLKSVLAFQSF